MTFTSVLPVTYFMTPPDPENVTELEYTVLYMSICQEFQRIVSRDEYLFESSKN
jgi:hypothetical protein